MNITRVHWTLAAAMVAIAFASPGRAGDSGAAAVSNQDLQAKVVFCKTCHGLAGQHGPVPANALLLQSAGTDVPGGSCRFRVDLRTNSVQAKRNRN
jgi:hypothetical protein